MEKQFEDGSSQNTKTVNLNERLIKLHGLFTELSERQNQIADNMLGSEPIDDKEEEKPNPAGWIGRMEHLIEELEDVAKRMNYTLSRLERV